MTENEAIKEHIKECNNRIRVIQRGLEEHTITNSDNWENNLFILSEVVEALEEIQQYRSIGTVEDIEKGIKQSEEEFEMLMEYKAIGLTPTMVRDLIKSCKKHEKHALENAHIVDEYREIGTVEEFKALKEKAEPKKILYRKQSYGTPWLCPKCEADQVKVEFFSSDGYEPKEKHSYCWNCGNKIDWT